MAQNRGHGGDQAHPHQHVACPQGGEQAAEVGGHVDDFHAAGGVAGVQLGEADENDHQEGAGAGTVISVVPADEKGRRPDDESAEPGGQGLRLVRPFVGPQGDEGHHRQHQQQQVFQYHRRGVVLEPGAAHGPHQRQHHGGGEQGPVHIALPDEAGGGKHGADAGGQLVGAQGVVGGEIMKPHQVGGHGDDAAASGDGVHKGPQENADADQQYHPEGYAVHRDVSQEGNHENSLFTACGA